MKPLSMNIIKPNPNSFAPGTICFQFLFSDKDRPAEISYALPPEDQTYAGVAWMFKRIGLTIEKFGREGT